MNGLACKKSARKLTERVRKEKGEHMKRFFSCGSG